jgi:hypothetical protein
MPVAVDTSDHIYDDFLRLLFLDDHRESSALGNDIPEESVTFVFDFGESFGYEDFHTA